MPGKKIFDSLLDSVRAFSASGLSPDEALDRVCRLLKETVPYYDWVGFYLVAGGRELVLGPYAGEPTEHTRIAFGSGICGQAADRAETFVVQDVRRETNYLSCSPSVRSEIVVPVFAGNRLVGELDIDSRRLAPFRQEDREFLEEVARLVAPLLQHKIPE